jgi:polygalacturonase
MSGGVRNIHVSDCTFIGTDVGLRFKSTRGRGGVVENIHIERIQMTDIPTEAIRFNLFYGGAAPTETDVAAAGDTHETIPPVTEETPSFRNILMRDIICRGADRAALFRGLPEMPVQNVRIENSIISSDKGILAWEVDGLALSNVQLTVNQGSGLALRNARNVVAHNVSIDGGSETRVRINGSKTRSIQLPDSTVQRNEVEIGSEVPAGAVRQE